MYTGTKRDPEYYERQIVSIIPTLTTNGDRAKLEVEIAYHNSGTYEHRVLFSDCQINELYCAVEWALPELQLELYEQGNRLPYVGRWYVNGKQVLGHELP